MARRDDLKIFAEKHQLKMITIKRSHCLPTSQEKLVERAVETVLETDYGNFTIMIYKNAIDDLEHLALVYGTVAGKENVLVRAHSECMTGDVFHSTHCDCRKQLDAAMKMIAEEKKE